MSYKRCGREFKDKAHYKRLHSDFCFDKSYKIGSFYKYLDDHLKPNKTDNTLYTDGPYTKSDKNICQQWAEFKPQTPKNCTCGIDSIGGGKHSDYCEKGEKV